MRIKPLTAAVFGLTLLATVIVLPPALRPDGALAESTITVNTATDDYTQYNGLCSLREAIESTNFDSDYGDCPTAAFDEVIRFALPNPSKIQLTSALPVITDTVGIDGALPGGGRVEVSGLPSFAGIVIGDFSSDDFAAGSSIRNLVLNGFSAGVHVLDTNVTIAGNYIGTNTAGTSAIANTIGIVATYTHGTKIGGSAGLTPGGPCTGDCNLISGNTYDGILLAETTTNGPNFVIEGNFIGTNGMGNAALPNADEGIFAGHLVGVSASITVANNLISGNGGYGVSINSKLTTFYGNRIGTNASGASAIPNGDGGISLFESYGGARLVERLQDRGI